MKNKILSSLLAFTSITSSIITINPANANSKSIWNFKNPIPNSKNILITQNSRTFLPAGNSQPNMTIGGAVRGNACDKSQANNSLSLIALVPHADQAISNKGRPTVVVATSGLKGETKARLTINSKKHFQYQDVIIKNGITPISLNETGTELKNGNYNWTLRILCSTDEIPTINDPFVNAVLKVDKNENNQWYEVISEAVMTKNNEQIQNLLNQIEVDLDIN